MAIQLTSRAQLETIEGLTAGIRSLQSDSEMPRGSQGYNRYVTQKAHWLGWLGDTPGTGSYERKTAPGRGARYVYNHIVEPKMLIWLIDASGVRRDLLSEATRRSGAARTLAGSCKAIRQVVPYSVVADALWAKLAV